jgi:hypothetical protein
MFKARTVGPTPPLNELAIIKHRMGLQTATIAALALGLIVVAGLLAMNAVRFALLAEKIPVRVVPGAAAGVYAPGITETNVLNAIRYVQQLGADLTPPTARARLEEIGRYCAPELLVKFRVAQGKLLEEIAAQQQSRSFIRDVAEAFTQDNAGVYDYRVSGPWEFRSGSVVMSNFRHEFKIRFTIGSPDQGNPYGIQLLSFDTSRLDNAN